MDTTFERIELSPAIGTEIVGLDLHGEISDRDVAALRDEFDRRHLLLVRGQQLDVEDQVSFVGVFGEVADERMNGEHHTYVSNVRGVSQTDLRGELLWHSDSTTTPFPMQGLSLYAGRVSGDVPATRFASCARGYRAAPAELLERLAGLETINIAGFKPDSVFDYSVERFAPRELPEDTYHNYRTTYPVLYPHPRTGEMLLFVNQFFSARIAGMDYEESEALYEEMFEVLYEPAFIYEHHWRQDDLLVWDNLALQHSRSAFAEGQDGVRDLRRVSINPDFEKMLDYAPFVRASLLFMEQESPRATASS
jgi:taurine dioxygenase